MRCFGDPKDTIDSKQLKNQIYLLRFGHTRALLFKKKRTRNGHFPRPRETDPYSGDKMRCYNAKSQWLIQRSSSWATNYRVIQSNCNK